MCFHAFCSSQSVLGGGRKLGASRWEKGRKRREGIHGLCDCASKLGESSDDCVYGGRRQRTYLTGV